jgi:hypothetical protein
VTLKNMSLDELRRKNEESQRRREQEKRDQAADTRPK